MDVKVCLGDDSVPVQVKRYHSMRGDNADKLNGRTTDPFKGTFPETTGLRSIETVTNNWESEGEEGKVRGCAPAISWYRTGASTMI